MCWLIARSGPLLIYWTNVLPFLQTHLVASGVAWVDDDDTRYYYIASLFVQQFNERSNSGSAADSTTGYESSSVRM